MNQKLASLAEADRFDTIIDVRTPLEFAEDHIPGAINAPVLSNEERVVVGTMYKQVSPFEATRYGAALVAKNIARHLETTFADRPINWKPLIYCWRGTVARCWVRCQVKRNPARKRSTAHSCRP